MSAFVSQKFLARAGGVVDPAKIFLSNLITKRNFITVSQTLRTYEGGPKSFGDDGAPPL